MIWTILGVSVAIVAVFCISVAETLLGKAVFENHRQYIALAFGAFGVVTFCIGLRLKGKRRAGQKENPDDAELSKNFILLDLRYWGPMLLVLGAITLFIRPLKQTKVEQVVAVAKPAAKEIVVQAPKPAPEISKPKAPVAFPALKMQGVILGEERTIAIINGRSYSVGDHVGNVVIASINREGVVLELDGELKSLTLK
jgi:hypothetical protein